MLLDRALLVANAQSWGTHVCISGTWSGGRCLLQLHPITRRYPTLLWTCTCRGGVCPRHFRVVPAWVMYLDYYSLTPSASASPQIGFVATTTNSKTRKRTAALHCTAPHSTTASEQCSEHEWWKGSGSIHE